MISRVWYLYIDRIWHVRYWRDEISIFGCNFVNRITNKDSFHYCLRSLNSRDENIRFEILNLYRVWIYFDNQNHLFSFIFFSTTQREMLNSAMFFIFIAMAVCGTMQGTTNARIFSIGTAKCITLLFKGLFIFMC